MERLTSSIVPLFQQNRPYVAHDVDEAVDPSMRELLRSTIEESLKRKIIQKRVQRRSLGTFVNSSFQDTNPIILPSSSTTGNRRTFLLFMMVSACDTFMSTGTV